MRENGKIVNPNGHCAAPLAAARFVTVAGVGALMVASVAAQESADGTTQEIDEIVVVAAEDRLSLMPAEPLSGTFGLRKALLDTPRSVTEVRAELVKRYALRSVDDLVRLTPGAFTSSFFGIRGAMDIRGEPADNYFRGFRRITNFGNFNTVVGGANTLEIMRGPVSPYYGAGSVGGQLNYLPKSAVDNIAGLPAQWSMDLTVGTYNQRAASFDAAFPSEVGGQPAGAHFFVDVEDSGSFYHGYAPTSELAQFTFSMGTTTAFEFGVQYQSTDSIQVPGWNRVTQELIDHGTYITGAPPRRNDPGNPVGADRLLPQEVGVIGAFAPPFLNNSFSTVGTFCNPGTTANHNFTYNGMLLDCPGTEPLTSLIAETVGTTTLDHRTSFIDHVDFVDTEALTAYAELSHAYNDRTVWRNEFFYDYLDYSKYHSWGFTALYPDAVAVEFRSSLSFETRLGPVFSRNVAGVSLRNEDLRKYHALFDETFDFRDIAAGPTPDDRLDWAVLDPYANAQITHIDGVPALEGTVRRNFDNVEFSQSDNVGVFLLADVVDGPFSLLLGGRYDMFHVEGEDVGRTLLGLPFDDAGVQRGRKGGPSHSVSASYFFEPGVVPYFTAARSSSLVTNQLGGIIPSTVESGAFLQQSELVEGGVKLNVVSGRVYAALAWYDQEKSLRGGLGRHTGGVGSGIGGRRIAAKGVELELRAVLNDRLSLMATATQTEALEVGDDVFTVINGADFARQNDLEPWQVYGGRVAGLRSTFIGNGVELERAGLPDRMFSFYATWSQPVFDGRMAATGGLLWASETHADAFEVISLPAYAVSTASLSFDRNRFRLLLQVNNLLDEKYYTSADLFEAVVVKPSEGRTVSLTVGWSFEREDG